MLSLKGRSLARIHGGVTKASTTASMTTTDLTTTDLMQDSDLIAVYLLRFCASR
ncbi:MAG TPA: hypothetical protein IGS37_19510 [Synechococcales cyanobacterium M55_K2018_004]|nr:hypothetical protein [Synechococcales cyanobacterium M55_K2018_004]